MILSIYNGVATARATMPQPQPVTRSSWFGIGGIQPSIPVHRRRRRRGIGDVNTDAETRLTTAGFRNVDCKFIPFQGPFSGGTNVCDVAGDDAGYQYGAELVNQPGGTTIMQTEIANAGAHMAARMKEQEVITANARRLQQEETANGLRRFTTGVPTPTKYSGPQQPVVSAHVLPPPVPLVINSSGVVSHGDGGSGHVQGGITPISSSGANNTPTPTTATGAMVGSSNGVPAFVTDAMNKVQDVTGDLSELSMPVKLGLGAVVAFMLYKAVK